jgi:hypothetical protein
MNETLNRMSGSAHTVVPEGQALAHLFSATCMVCNSCATVFIHFVSTFMELYGSSMVDCRADGNHGGMTFSSELGDGGPSIFGDLL